MAILFSIINLNGVFESGIKIVYSIKPQSIIPPKKPFDYDSMSKFHCDALCSRNVKLYYGLMHAMESLTVREQQILEERYFNQLTLKDIGKAHNITPSRVQSILAKALRKLNHPDRLIKIKESMEL